MSLLKSHAPLPVTLVRGEGCYVWDEKGRRYLDMYGGHAVCSTGHCHPIVVRALQEQARRLIFYSTAVDLEIRREAARRMIERMPGFAGAFFVNSGAEAVENAVKVAVLQTGRKTVVAMEGSFHGRTLLALNLTHGQKVRATIPYPLPDVRFVPFGDLGAAEKAIDRTTAAVILEPIQSLAGVRMAGSEYYPALADACRRNGALLIYDEVQTGMGRTGTMLFSGRFGVTPDLACLAKGIASGFPAGAVLASPPVAEKIQFGQLGSTFGGGPLAMAAVCATLDVFDREGVLDNVRAQGERLQAGLRPICEVRGLGLLLGLRTPRPAAEIQKALLERGVLTGTCNDPSILRLLPPLTLSAAQVDEFLDAFCKTV